MRYSKVIVFLAILFMPLSLLADMTDQQIIKYVTEQSAKGTGQGDMIQYLLSQGVSPTRLQMLKSKMGKQSTSVGRIESQDRGRTVTSSSGRLMGTPSNNGKFDTNGEDYIAMQEAITGFVPDSTSQKEPQSEGIKVFGRDMFRNESISFEPNMNIPTPSTYVLGAGDLVYIDVYGASQTTIDGTISPDGCIVVEGYGPLQLSGLTVEEANRRARAKLGECFADSKIKLTVGQTRSIQVNVMGEVKVPGTYTLSAFASVFHALYSAGGVSELGSLRSVKLYRNNKLMNTVDVYDYILNGQLSGDIRLQDNDVLVVAPYDVLVNISGKAKRPMYYEMKPSESIAKALEYAGGLASDAYTKSMRLIRKAGGTMKVFNVDQNNMDSFVVADGDSLFIDSLLLRYENMVELNGAVFRPGKYQLGDQISSVKSLIQYADGVSESAFTTHAVLRRRRDDRSWETVSINLEGILSGRIPDVTLKNEDVLFVPDKKSMQEHQTLAIYGEVFNPGIYEFAHNTTVEDLVLQAGGLKNSASLHKVTVSRRDRDGHIKVLTLDLNESLTVDMSSSLVLEPQDVVAIKRIEGYRDQQTVHVSGEVNFQGDFSLPAEKARISDVIAMAGGMTEKAAENGVYVLRKMSEEEHRIRQQRLDQERYGSTYNAIIRSSQMQGVTTLPISDSLLVKMRLREDVYKVAVDIRKALKSPGCAEDLVLRDGDRIIVEGQKNTVLLSGTLPYKGAVPYVEGKTLKHYLRQGGIRPTRRNLKMSYVIDQNGQAHAYRRFKKVEPGSEVFLRETTSEMTTAQKVSILVSVASTFATAAAVVVSVLK